MPATPLVTPTRTMYGIEGLLAGRTLAGRYLIREVIGRGGMGAVYRSSDERLGREVAVKVVSVAAPDAQAHARLRARFHREARAAARLRHPNVVAIHDFGTDAELELDFLVMELLRGEDLAARFARRDLPDPAGAIEIARQAAAGVAAGHRAGLIHRDIKPGNLYLEREDGGAPVVKVLDFGIAEITAGDEATLTHLTVAGRSPFSPAFASPEQLRGETRLTPATDVFSLGAVLYQLLTGDRAFISPDPQRAAVEVSAAVADFRRRAPDAPAGIHDVLRHALAPHPDDRFPDAAAFGDALANHRSAQPAAARRYAAGRTRLLDDDGAHTRVAPDPAVRRPPPQHATGRVVASPPRPGRMRRALGAVGSFLLTATSLALAVGAWAQVFAALRAADLGLLYLGTAATVPLTPLAIHQLLRTGGSYRFALLASIAGSGATVYLFGADRSVETVLGILFVVQIGVSILAEVLTRRAAPDDAPLEGV